MLRVGEGILSHAFVDLVLATVSVYNKETYAAKHPQNWAEFWGTKAFPGPRALPNMVSGQPALEFALLADGVAPGKLYPVDLPRAFKALTRIRASVPKFWDTGALSAQLLSDKEVMLGARWSGRVQTIIDTGAPLAIEWNQNTIQIEAYGMPKNTRDMKPDQLFVDFTSQASAQAGYSKDLATGLLISTPTTCCRRSCWRSCRAGRNIVRWVFTRISTGGKITATK